MNNLILIATLSLLATGCGKSSDRSRSASVIEPRVSNEPIYLESSSRDCLATSFERDQLEIPLHLFLSGSPTQQTKNFRGLFDGIFLRDINKKSIAKTLYGEKINILRLRQNSENKDYLISKQSGQDVTICPGDNTFNKNSVEAASLNASYYIHQVYSKVMPLMPDSFIKPITLKVGSVWKYDNREEVNGVPASTLFYMTDNALYDPYDNSITFFPHSKARKWSYSMNFWEVPMVAAHEYGHHIFNTLSPQTEEKSAISSCFGHASSLQNNILEIKRVVTEVKNQDVLHSLNEGFADLIAYYGLSKHERGVDAIPGLQLDRDVSSEWFFHGAKKTFSDDALSGFFSPASANIAQIFYQSSHVFGAIFAHRADVFMSSQLASEPQKLEIILAWAKQIGSSKSEMAQLTPRDYFEKTLELLIDLTLKRTNKDKNAATCQEIFKLYPGFEASLASCFGV